MNCTLCQKHKNIIYYDYGLKTSIRLCYSCLKSMGWYKEINELLPKLHICPSCKSRFLSKKPDPIKCGVCWNKYFRKDDPIKAHVIQAKPQKGVLAYG